MSLVLDDLHIAPPAGGFDVAKHVAPNRGTAIVPLIAHRCQIDLEHVLLKRGTADLGKFRLAPNNRLKRLTSPVAAMRLTGSARVKADGSLPMNTKLRSSKYLNNLIDAGPSKREATHRCDAWPQAVPQCGDHNRRHRADAPHPQGAVRVTTSWLWRASSTRIPVLPICTEPVKIPVA